MLKNKALRLSVTYRKFNIASYYPKERILHYCPTHRKNIAPRFHLASEHCTIITPSVRTLHHCPPFRQNISTAPGLYYFNSCIPESNTSIVLLHTMRRRGESSEEIRTSLVLFYEARWCNVPPPSE